MSAYSAAVAKWQSHQLRSPADLDRLLFDFTPRFTYHSALLEGREIAYSTVEEFFHTGAVSHFSGDPKELVQLYSHKRCYDYLREHVMARDDLDTLLVLEIHRLLTSGTYSEPFFLANGERPGELKKQNFCVAAHGNPACVL